MKKAIMSIFIVGTLLFSSLCMATQWQYSGIGTIGEISGQNIPIQGTFSLDDQLYEWGSGNPVPAPVNAYAYNFAINSFSFNIGENGLKMYNASGSVSYLLFATYDGSIYNSEFNLQSDGDFGSSNIWGRFWFCDATGSRIDSMTSYVTGMPPDMIRFTSIQGFPDGSYSLGSMLFALKTDPTPVPEPAVFFLLSLGFISIFFFKKYMLKVDTIRKSNM